MNVCCIFDGAGSDEGIDNVFVEEGVGVDTYFVVDCGKYRKLKRS